MVRFLELLKMAIMSLSASLLTFVLITFLLPTLIYQGKSNDLQSSWVEDVKEEEVAYFAATDSGWIKDTLEV